MRRCIFVECRKQPPGGPGRFVSFHSFPREMSILSKWIAWVQDVCGRHNFKHHSLSSSLCSRHFEEKCFRKSGRLYPDVVPTITPEDLYKAEITHRSGRLKPSIQYVAKEQVSRVAEEIPASSTLHELEKSTPSTLSPCNDNREKSVELSDLVLEVQSEDAVSASASTTEVKRMLPFKLSPGDYNSCQNAKLSVNTLNIALNKTRSRLHSQAKKITRVTKAMLDIKSIVEQLRKEDMLSEEGETQLSSAIHDILDHMNFKQRPII